MAKNRFIALLIPLFIFLIALAYRSYGVLNTPFWVDEFSTAFQANLMRKYTVNLLTQQDYYVEYHNFTPHFLVASSFEWFGESTKNARLPFIVIGSLVPVCVWLFGKKVLKDDATALAAAILTTFSYFEITWSRQARGYVLQQTFLLFVLMCYFWLFSAKSRRSTALAAGGLLLGTVGGVLTHLTFLFVVVALGLHAAWYFRKEVKQKLLQNRVLMGLSAASLLLLGYLSFGPVTRFISFLLSGHVPNNLPYYHSFLWREYGVIIILSLIGYGYGLLKQQKVFTLLGGVSLIYLFFFSFIFEPRVSRYLLPIFPLLFISAGLGLRFLSESFVQLFALKPSSKQLWLTGALPVLLALLIVVNGDKFVLKPKPFYSVNHDFREIALIDYDQVYQLIKEKGELEEGQTAVIDTWGDRLAWYLGPEFESGYVFRWTNESELLKQTAFEVNEAGEKIVAKRKGMRLISSVEDLQRAMEQYPKGFIWIDDSSLPADVLEFAEKNFKVELYQDHYPLDDNPYSIWPGTLYSWGL